MRPLPFADLAPSLRRRLSVGVGRIQLRKCDALGRNVRIFGSPVIVNDGRIEIGHDFRLSSAPICSHLATGTQGRLLIGDDVCIGHGASVYAHELIEIGEGTRIGPMVMLLDIDFHEVKSRDSMGTARPIRIGKNVRIGSGVVILRGAVIGDEARIAPNSVVARAVPAGVFASGVPARPTPPS